MNQENHSDEENYEMAQIICPKCDRPMGEWTSHGVTLDHCNTCKGLWFDEGELSQHLAFLGTPLSEEDLEVSRKTRIQCPRCGEGSMIEASLDEVPVDACRSCQGIFLDLGEVHELMGAVYRADRPADQRTRGVDNLNLGLHVGAHLGRNLPGRKRNELAV